MFNEFKATVINCNHAYDTRVNEGNDPVEQRTFTEISVALMFNISLYTCSMIKEKSSDSVL